ncbi:MAG TPA: TadE family protein [Kineosporiaceae bacterium]
MTSSRTWTRPGRSRRGDRGAAVVDFVLVGALATLVFVGVLQLAVVLHVRNTLIDCASEGARYGALADRGPADGARRAAGLIGQDLSPRYARDVTGGIEDVGGLPTVVVQVRAPLPVLGLLGAGVVTVVGHALREPP